MFGLFNRFRPKSTEEVAEYLRGGFQSTISSANWCVLSFNHASYGDFLRNYQFDFQNGDRTLAQLRLGIDRTNGDLLHLESGGRTWAKLRLLENPFGIYESISEVMHKTFQSQIERFKPYLESERDHSQLNLSQEDRGVMWLETSFRTVKGALEQVRVDSSKLLQSTVYMGIRPDTGRPTIRVIVYNLDIFLFVSEDDRVHVVVYNDVVRDHTLESAQAPQFQQTFFWRRREVFDQFIHLFGMIGQTAHLRTKLSAV